MKRKVKIIIALLLIVCIGLTGCSSKDEKKKPVSSKEGSTSTEIPEKEIKSTETPKEESAKTLLDAVQWVDNSREVEAFKKLAIVLYPDKTIGEALTGDYAVIEWKYGKSQDEEFLLCNYTYGDEEYILIFTKNSKENVNISEYYIGVEGQDRASITACADKIFGTVKQNGESEPNSSNEFSDNRIGYFSNGYWGMHVKSIDNTSKTFIYDGYEYAIQKTKPCCIDEKGTIVDENTVDIYGIQIHWDEDSFTINDGNDAVIMSSMRGGTQAHDVEHGAGTYVRSKLPEGESSSISSEYMPLNGEYNNASDGEASRIVVTAVDSASFKFKIYKYSEGNDGDSLIFKEHIARFETQDSTSAVYRGKEYTVWFDCSEYATIVLSGFEEATTLGNTFWNSKALNAG